VVAPPLGEVVSVKVNLEGNKVRNERWLNQTYLLAKIVHFRNLSLPMSLLKYTNLICILQEKNFEISFRFFILKPNWCAN